MKKFAFVLFSCLSVSGYTQSKVMVARVSGTDTTLYATLPTFTIREYHNAESKKRYLRLEADIKRVYPYARLGATILESYHDSIANAQTEQEVSKFYKKAEQQLKHRYGREITQLNHRQGILLIKLIDRETQHSSYEIISNSRSSITASVYQGIARIWGYNLKTRYNATQEYEIESIILDLYGNS